MRDALASPTPLPSYSRREIVLRRLDQVERQQAGRLGLGMAHLFRGDLVSAEEHFRAVLARRRSQQRVHILQFKEDPRAVAGCFSAHALAMLGFPDRALQAAQSCLTYGEAVRDPLALTFALLALQFVHQFRGEYGAAARRAHELLELTRAQGFRLHETIAVLACAEAAIVGGELDHGIQLFRAGWEGYRLTGAELGSTHWQCQLLEAHVLAGNIDAAWETFESARENVQRMDEHHWEAELYRLHAELLRPSAPDAAERSLTTALDLARSRHQRAFELRAAHALAALWRARGQGEQARALLRDVYESFSEGFETLDLRRARALLDELREYAAPAEGPSPS